MRFQETKTVIFSLLIFALAVFVLPKLSDATDYSSSNFTVKDSVIDSGVGRSTSTSYGLGQSVSQIAIGRSTSASFELWSGFQYYLFATQNTLTATTIGDTQIDLSWTVPSTFLGAVITGYEVGVGTTSGSYTFTDVGNVVASSQLGLIPGTNYYFIIKAYSAGNVAVVFSNEATALTTGVAPQTGNGGGLPPAGYYGAINISGKVYPSANVTILLDGVVVNSTTANSSGDYTFSINDLTTRSYSIGIYATDSNGTRSPTLGMERSVTAGVTTSVTNANLAPTIRQSHASIRQGENITFSGSTAPNVPVTLTFGGARNSTTTVNSNVAGYYTYSLPTGSWSRGSYTVYSDSLVNGIRTPNSFALSFSIADATVTPPPTPRPGTCPRSDLSCDGKVDLVDFSILLYYWEQTDFSQNPKVDINKDGSVGIKDLSIMLYDWTG